MSVEIHDTTSYSGSVLKLISYTKMLMIFSLHYVLPIHSQPLPSGPSKGSQGFQSVPECQPLWDSIGRPMMHLSQQ